MKLKTGVKVDGLSPEMWVAAGFAWCAYEQFAIGKEFVITSAIDGAHRKNSLHYSGKAIDLRTRHLTEDQALHIYSFMDRKLGPLGWDVVLESDHIHCEFDSKPGERFIRWTA